MCVRAHVMGLVCDGSNPVLAGRGGCGSSRAVFLPKVLEQPSCGIQA